MLQLIYASAATHPFTPADLNRLLERARSRNDLFRVTGMLLYHSGSFLQVIEGPQTGIDMIYRSIERDPRHCNPKVLLRQTITQREFEGWSMGFADITRFENRPRGFLDYHKDLATCSNAPTRAGQYLRFFQQGLCRRNVAL